MNLPSTSLTDQPTVSLGIDNAAPTETGLTITHRGRPYAILTTLAQPSFDGDGVTRYLLRSKRGKLYILIRNKVHPHMLFGISGLSVLPGWFSDKDGSLQSLG